MISKVFVMFICVMLIGCPIETTYGNAGPMIAEEDPVFSMMPLNSTPIAVERERLTIDFRQENAYTANVTAAYTMTNQEDQSITQKMLFPIITAPVSDFIETVRITVDGTPVTFETYRLQDYAGENSEVDPIHRYDDYVNRAKELNLHELTRLWQERSKPLKHVSLEDEIQVLQFRAEAAEEESYEISINYQIDPEVQRLMVKGFTFHSWKGGETGSFGKWIETKEHPSPSHELLIYVWGKPLTEEQLTFSEEVSVTTKKMLLADLIEEITQHSMYAEDMNSKESYAAFILEKLDELMGSTASAFHLDSEVINAYAHRSYVGALVYEVAFEPNSKKEVVIDYHMTASSDRTDTSRYSSLTAYLLQPASGWKDFNDLTINVFPHKDQPYLLESSLSLEWHQEQGAYTGYFEQLPEENLIFRLYHRDSPETGLVRIFSNPYILLLVVPAVLILGVLLTVTLVVLVALKKNKMNLRQ